MRGESRVGGRDLTACERLERAADKCAQGGEGGLLLSKLRVAIDHRLYAWNVCVLAMYVCLHTRMHACRMQMEMERATGECEDKS